MDIERLTKAQIVLLTLLISFVTSIATGIVTVTLLDQAPPAVTQTINRVVERTVERVVPGESQKASVITKEVTTVVKEEDLIPQSITKSSKALVRISRVTIDGVVFSGLGVIASHDGIVATDSALVTEGGEYIVELPNGTKVETVILENSVSEATALLKIVSKETLSLFPIGFSDINALKLGQTVIALSGAKSTSVSTGIIGGLNEEEIEITNDESNVIGEKIETKTVSVLSSISTTVDGTTVLKGSPLINIFGEVVGISTFESRTDGIGAFTPIQVIQSQIRTATEVKVEVK
ncbi:MAG: trypsin-like peptidase domain-containing protein [Parcubacteria group bacterium]|nr:trypsin-like peptidase domain-containing protein [Parcubacteria group bacterium]